ncbi:hypothetical protein SLEP1_g13750 [Rubroshorea leprosula]|uniref:L-ascorbate oxidase n=1 Tax=Rubroshorea leprosula TaxID=152421 RepID=A0AAV5IPW4_9ROSI|nr:hypothetical protein SLEP1_g13750 [Rubroshorea leprosula]
MASLKPALALLCGILLCFLVQVSLAAKVRHHKWAVEYMFWSPDCVEHVVMGINGQFPGPTIRATAGDTIVVELTNKLYTEGVAIPPEKYDESYDVMKPAVNQNATYGNGVYVFDLNSTVDVILQNANALTNGTSEIHPWHLHGHDFWVLGNGEGKFTEADVKKFNLKNPPLKNTAVIFPFGWTALRFVADNPGVWAFHCHIEPHLHMGMGVVFAEGVQKVGRIPSSALACGMTGRRVANKN